ncbi:MAG: hypothetical protein ABI551_04640, partial [Polyangiaceae bacterium]
MRSTYSLRFAFFASLPIGLLFAACSGTSDGGTIPSTGSDDDGGTTIERDGGKVATDAGKKDAAATTYPAKHPAAPQVESYGGAVLANPHILPIVFEGDPKKDEIKDFTHKL